jgi:hypothetical protein
VTPLALNAAATGWYAHFSTDELRRHIVSDRLS